MHPHLRQHVSDFDSLFCLSLVWVPESRVNWDSGFLGGGEVHSAGGCKEGCDFHKPRAFWSLV